MTDVTKAPDADELAERVRSLFAGNNTAGGITGPLSNGERYFILPQSSVEADHNKLSEARKTLATHAAQIEALRARCDTQAEFIEKTINDCAGLTEQIEALRAERDALRNLVQRAQIVGSNDLPDNWHRDARAALGGPTDGR